MEKIETDLIYNIYFNENNKTIYITDSVKVKHLPKIRFWLIDNGYYFKNIIIGQPYDW